MEKQIEKLLDRSLDATTPIVVTAYESRSAKPERGKIRVLPVTPT